MSLIHDICWCCMMGYDVMSHWPWGRGFRTLWWSHDSIHTIMLLHSHAWDRLYIFDGFYIVFCWTALSKNPSNEIKWTSFRLTSWAPELPLTAVAVERRQRPIVINDREGCTLGLAAHSKLPGRVADNPSNPTGNCINKTNRRGRFGVVSPACISQIWPWISMED